MTRTKPKRWYKVWQTEIIAISTLIAAVAGAITASDSARKTVVEWFSRQPGIVDPIEYRKSAKNTEELLTSFKLPSNLLLGFCTDLFAHGNALRASIPTITEIQNHVDDLGGDKTGIEKRNAREFLNNIFAIEKQANGWKIDAAKSGCFEIR